MKVLALQSYRTQTNGYRNNPSRVNIYTPVFTGQNTLIPPTNPNLQNSLGKDNIDILDKIRKVGENHETETFLFGGGVRDTLMGKKSNDLDILVNGNALDFTKHLENELGDDIETVKYRTKLKTQRGVIKTKSGIKLDIVPIAEDGSRANNKKELKAALTENVSRRDFSINTMLIKLGSKKDGRLKLKFIDIQKRRPDLKENILKVVNKTFFLNNPVQVARGIRFKTKYGMTVDENTQQLMRESIEHPQKRNVKNYRFKIIREFYRTFKSTSPVKAIKEIIKSKSYKLLYK